MLRKSCRLNIANHVPPGYVAYASGANVDSVLDGTTNFRRMEAMVAHNEQAASEQPGFFSLPRIDYDTSRGIAPVLSHEQFKMLYHIFHKDSVIRLNQHTLGSELEGHNLDVVIRKTAFDASRAVIHTAAAEHFNYCFWYRSLLPWGTDVPSSLREALQLQYSKKSTLDAVEEIKRLFLIHALSAQAPCGWVYLLWNGKAFDVDFFSHGTCPIGSNLIPLLGLNLHTSAIYVDYLQGQDSDRPEEALTRYVRNFFKACNWDMAARYYLQCTCSA